MKPSLARIILLVLSLAALPVFAAEVTLLSGGAAKAGLGVAIEAWQARTGHRVKAIYAPAGEIRQRLGAGERFDVVVLPAENIAALGAAKSYPLAATGIGVAVKKGAPLPDISTPEAVKRMLIEAKSLTYMDPARGTSGKFIDEVVLPKLGVRDAVRAKATLGQGGMIAEKVERGEVELALHQITEILPVAGVTLVGPLPPELQKVTVYSGVVMPGASASEEARSLLEFLVTPEGRKPFLERGFSLP